MNLSFSVNKVGKEIWVVIVFKIWDHRNKVVFRSGVVDAEEIFCLDQLKVWS